MVLEEILRGHCLRFEIRADVSLKNLKGTLLAAVIKEVFGDNQIGGH